MKSANVSVQSLVLAISLGMIATLPQVALAQDTELKEVKFLRADTITEPGQSNVALTFKIKGGARQCYLKSPQAPNDFVFQASVVGEGEHTIHVKAPDYLKKGTEGKEKYIVKCTRGPTKVKGTMKVPYRIPGIVMTVTPSPIVDAAAQVKAKLKVLAAEGKTVENCKVALPHYHGGAWVLDEDNLQKAGKQSKGLYKLKTILSADNQRIMGMNHCGTMPFKARCKYSGEDAGKEVTETTVKFQPIDSDMTLTTDKTMLENDLDYFNLTLTQEGDLKQCWFEVNGTEPGAGPLHRSNITLNGPDKTWHLNARALGVTQPARGSTNIKIDIFCDTQTSINNGKDKGMCRNKTPTLEKSVDVTISAPPLVMTVVEPSEVTAIGQQVTIRYERNHLVPVSCDHNENFDGRTTWPAPGTGWSGGSLVTGNSVTLNFMVPPDSANVSQLAFRASCRYGNGMVIEAQEVTIPVNLPVVSGISGPTTEVNCNRIAIPTPNVMADAPSNTAPNSIDLAYTRSGPATACEYSDNGGIDWVRFADDAFTSGEAFRSSNVPSCSSLGLLTLGATTRVNYQVRCFPAKDSRSSGTVSVTVANRPPPVPTRINIRLIEQTSFYLSVKPTPAATSHDWAIRPQGQNNFIVREKPTRIFHNHWDSHQLYRNWLFGEHGALRPNTVYEVKVRARNAAGFSPWSESMFPRTNSGITNLQEGLLNGYRWLGYHFIDKGGDSTSSADFPPAHLQTDIHNFLIYKLRDSSNYGARSTYSLYNNGWNGIGGYGRLAYITLYLGALATAPPPQRYRAYFNTVNNTLYYDQGSGWEKVTPKAPVTEPPADEGSQSGGDPPQT